MSDETEAELKILEAAKFVFERDGYAGARMQAIADEASLSKSLLHYYFRSKEKLFDRIFDETMEAFMAIVATWDEDNEDWEAKLRRFISSLFTFLRHKSLLFILRELNRNPDLLVKKRAGKSKHKRNRFIVYMEQLQATGRVMQSVDPRMIYMAMHSLCAYPILNAAIFKMTMQMSDKEYERYLDGIPEWVASFLIQGIKIKEEAK